VYYPIHNNSQDDYLRNTVALAKDVEGLSHRYIFNLYQNIRFLDADSVNPNQKSILPCTPLAVIKILEYLRIYNTILPFGNRLFGHTITVINRSEVVGRPLAALLANDGACVYSVDVTGVQQFSRGQGIRNRKHEVVDKEGWTLEQCLPISDVVISGVPGDKYKVPVHLLRDGAVCVNFSSEKVGQSCIAFTFPLPTSHFSRLTSIPSINSHGTNRHPTPRISHPPPRKKQQFTFQQSGKSQSLSYYAIYFDSLRTRIKHKPLLHHLSRLLPTITNGVESTPTVDANGA